MAALSNHPVTTSDKRNYVNLSYGLKKCLGGPLWTESRRGLWEEQLQKSLTAAAATPAFTASAISAATSASPAVIATTGSGTAATARSAAITAATATAATHAARVHSWRGPGTLTNVTTVASLTTPLTHDGRADPNGTIRSARWRAPR